MVWGRMHSALIQSYSRLNDSMKPGFEDHFDAAVLLVTKGLVHVRPLLQPNSMGDHKRRIDLTLQNSLQQIVGPAIDVGLSGADGEPFVHHRAKWNLIQQPTVNPGNGQGPSG